MQPSDDEWIRRIRAGDERAFEGLVRRWSSEILGLAYRLTGDLEEARDIRQMALLKTYDALDSFNASARFSTWLYRIVVNLCRDRQRRTSVRERADREAAERNGHIEKVGPQRLAEAADTARRVAQAVAALPPGEREVVVLRHYHELSFPEIAAIQGAPVTTIRSRMSSGVGRLRTRLKDLET